jgi:hypothetical protein
MDDESKSSFEELISSLKEYFNIQKEILKLEAAEKASELFSEAASMILIVGFFFAVFFFLSFALAYGLSSLLESMFYGFAIVSGLYLVIALILLKGKDRLLKTPMMNLLIKSFLKNGTQKD